MKRVMVDLGGGGVEADVEVIEDIGLQDLSRLCLGHEAHVTVDGGGDVMVLHLDVP
jgi:hypothetical protein